MNYNVLEFAAIYRKRCVLRWRRKESNVSEERIEPGREFQIVGGSCGERVRTKNMKISARNL